jgi:hypothetical protein
MLLASGLSTASAVFSTRGVVLCSISRNTSGATGGDRRNFTHDVTATTEEHANSVDAGLTVFGLSPCSELRQ